MLSTASSSPSHSLYILVMLDTLIASITKWCIKIHQDIQYELTHTYTHRKEKSYLKNRNVSEWKFQRAMNTLHPSWREMFQMSTLFVVQNIFFLVEKLLGCCWCTSNDQTSECEWGRAYDDLFWLQFIYSMCDGVCWRTFLYRSRFYFVNHQWKKMMVKNSTRAAAIKWPIFLLSHACICLQNVWHIRIQTHKHIYTTDTRIV